MNKYRTNKVMPWVVSVLISLLSACDAVEVEQASGPTLCYEYYRQCISPVLQSQSSMGMGCADSGCHSVTSTGGGNLKIDASGSMESYYSVKSFTNILESTNSQLLVYPPNPGHPGVGLSSALADSGNRCYIEILTWIENPKDDPFHAECDLTPNCVVPTNAATDC